MTHAQDTDNSSDRKEVPAHRVRLPGFITEDQVGLGDALKRATTWLGIRRCGGCERRAAALNRWIAFTR